MSMLNEEELRKRIEQGMVENIVHLPTQLDRDKLELTVDEVYRFAGRGKQDFSDSEQEKADLERVRPVKEDAEDEYGWFKLVKGSYLVKTNELINLKNDIEAIASARDIVPEIGLSFSHQEFEPGYTGKMVFITTVENPEGVDLKENARLVELRFKKT